MIGSIIETRISAKNPFAGKWDGIVDAIARVFKLSHEDMMILKGSKIAKLIAAIPFVAECREPKRTALTNLTTYLLTKKNFGIFDSKPSDEATLIKRLSIFDTYIDGESKLIEKGMNLLALSLLCEYNRTMEEDFEFGRYNPLLSGSLEFEAEKDFLLKRIASLDCKYLDEILTTFEAQMLWW